MKKYRIIPRPFTHSIDAVDLLCERRNHMISIEQLNECKNILQERQTRLIQDVQEQNGAIMNEKDAVGELSSYDNHPADMGSELYERGKDAALLRHSEKELAAINEAFHAMDEGTYGICSTCGVDIPFERLQAVPTTEQCKVHAEEIATVKSDHRPVEEEAFSPNINPHEEREREEEQVSYDAEDAWQEVSRYGTSETPSDFYGDRDNYSEMYPNSDEKVGATEIVEEILEANISGSYVGYATNLKSEYASLAELDEEVEE